MAAKRGRPRDAALSRNILTSTLAEVAQNGLHGARLDVIAASAHTSKQALYRRWPSKDDLICEAVRHGFSRIPAQPPGSASLMDDLLGVTACFQEALTASPLGKAYLCLATSPHTAAEARLIEGEQRTYFRQMFVFHGTTVGMEEKIDSILAHLFYRVLLDKPPLGNIALKNFVSGLLRE
ncbi:TetR/AcrR family transcriptional regulator [Pseudovibrio exalbescens]|uniref:HTH tetR-type domain-containing protein n=1 Tax=Pseudovibrio exalbescens TaxID=197461 RepID=A0A1U7JDS5_9HYPH|nr:TetR/AcrR family transcriptional regulator [Pseudovibrio exalbescens]OKL42855.1 hypothetical protein A3843_16955 [Pseudovibrio exalbescens]